MANQVRFTPLPELVRLAKVAKEGGCDVTEIIGDRCSMYSAQGALIDFYEAATPIAFLALVTMSRGHMEETHRAHARCAQLEAELSDLRSRMLEAK
ncbi:hypothetical protein [Pseudomonas sp. HN8-3]|uniref:hypothetical protein n=1 Tax=Pseudomonas sp. HN8-3 TaxID=2886361 RepID=UPI001E476407|nr:hypothetical protein [Pseudomonas sp. HN8-3]UEH09720.1 hypothetical protein LJX92_06360 [Pseudomonas sp. HN8-3]